MKILVGVDKGTYTFNASGQTITLSGIPTISLTQLLLITNVTSNEIIYSPVIAGKGGSISSNVITLDFNTTSMNNGDDLQIFVHLDEDVTFKYSTDNLDSFGAIPVNSPIVTFDSSLEFDSDADSWEYITTTGGSYSYSTFSSSMNLIVGPTAGSSVIREQHGYNYYIPGIGNTILMTGVMGASASNLTKRIGYYNEFNGFYFEQENGVMFVCLRSYSSGTVTTQRFTQSSWNRDRMDGSNGVNNPSGITFNSSKSHIFFFDFQWLGVGRVRYGLVIDGDKYIIHEIMNANVIDSTYMGNPSLPCRYEIFTTGNIVGTSTLKSICASVQSNNNNIPLSRSFSVSSGATSKTISSGVRTSLISLRLSQLLDGRLNRSRLIVENIDIVTTSNVTTFVEVVLQRSNRNETNLGGTPTWTSVNNSAAEFSVNGTTVTGGSVLWSGYVTAATRNVQIELNTTHDFLSNNWNCSQSDYIHIVCTPIGNNAAMLGAIKYLEVR